MQTTSHETAAWNLVFYEKANMGITIKVLRDQLYSANDEYRGLKVKLEKVQEKLDTIHERHDVVRRGRLFEAFDGERAGLEIQEARLEGQAKVLEEGMRRWLIIIEESIKTMLAAVSRLDITET